MNFQKMNMYVYTNLNCFPIFFNLMWFKQLCTINCCPQSVIRQLYWEIKIIGSINNHKKSAKTIIKNYMYKPAVFKYSR